MKFKDKSKKVVVAITNKMLKTNANTTGCVYVYQPKMPKQLSQFSKIKNDK
ncbi:MAG: cyclic lactone autoinducer peptide [Clostridia bacterium]|nr:cyclic lactone autoinducer peptide [Clostridia bacterium]